MAEPVKVPRGEEKLVLGRASKQALTDTVGTGPGQSGGRGLRPTEA